MATVDQAGMTLEKLYNDVATWRQRKQPAATAWHEKKKRAGIA